MTSTGANWSPWSSNLTKRTPAAGATLLPPPNPANASITNVNVGLQTPATYASRLGTMRTVRNGLPKATNTTLGSPYFPTLLPADADPTTKGGKRRSRKSRRNRKSRKSRR